MDQEEMEQIEQDARYDDARERGMIDSDDYDFCEHCGQLTGIDELEKNNGVCDECRDSEEEEDER